MHIVERWDIRSSRRLAAHEAKNRTSPDQTDRLPCRSCLLPWFLVSQDLVEDCEEFPHVGGDGEFWWFTEGTQGKAARELVAQTDHDAHEEAARTGAADASDGGPASEGATVAVDWRQSGKAGDFVT